MPDSLRLFVAIELPGEVREALGRLQHELQQRGLEKLRWVRPEGIHLTLKFLGATPAEKVPAIDEALRHVTEGIARHVVSLNRLGRFGRWRRLSVVWVGLAGNLTQLGHLQLRVDRALRGLGFPSDDRKFEPHLTLARVPFKLATELSDPADVALRAVAVQAIEFEVREISLMQSTLRPSGAIYERVAAFPLGEA
jgi:RNA 2',3'-cyclic 3'-phosphodiesterase